MKRVPIAVLASGRGSNFDAIAKAVAGGKLAAEIVAVISDRAGAPVLEKAKAAGFRPVLVEAVKGQPREEHDRRVLEALRPHGARFLVMAGYMRIVTPTLIEAFRSERGYARITNVHPSLLPSFPGVGSYAQAFEHGAGLTGVTVHLVEPDVDSGPVCAQESFSIADCRSAGEVEKRGLAIEHRLYPETLGWVLPEKFEVEKRKGRLCVRPS